MASSSESDMLTTSEDLTDYRHEVVHQISKGKEKIVEPSDFTTSPEAHESSPSLKEESNEGEEHVNWEIDADKSSEVPEVGQVFASEEEAYEFYNAYGFKEGFSIRRDRVEKRRNGEMYVRHFTCSKGGHRMKDHRRVIVKKRRAETKTGCLARLVIRLNDDMWVVKVFIADHNHPKASPSKKHLLRSQRRVQPCHIARIKLFEDVGVRPADGIELMAKEAGGKENLGFINMDYKNFVRSMKKRNNEVGEGEAQRVMDYFKRMQSENPSFFYAVQVNSYDQMTNFFWADARSIADYGYFGDVVSFDTTYRTNKHFRPFAPIVGVNHHRQTILFGAALLLDETTKSFVWLFKTFLDAMSGRKPTVILTDQCAAMAKAIKIVMPETNHRLCLWHIFQNAAKHLPHKYKNRDFTRDFKNCIYKHETEEAFLLAWNQMLIRHELVENEWLKGLFEFHKKWALVFGRKSFCAEMTTTQRSESINSLLKKFLKRKYSLPEVLLRYEKILSSRREAELKADFDSSQNYPVLNVNAPMLKQVAKEYTREMFEKFQKEFQKFFLYDVEKYDVNGSIQKYKVTNIEGGEECLITLDASNSEILCSCKKFEFAGIQCKHVIKVLNSNGIHTLPSKYILKRWRKDARTGVVNNNVGNPIETKANASMGSRYGSICRMAINLATKGAFSEEAHLVAMTRLEHALKDVEAVLEKTQVTTFQNNIPIPKMSDGESPLGVTLTLAQANEKGRPTNARIKSCLERGQGRKRSKVNLHGESETNIGQPKPKKGRKGKNVPIKESNTDPLINVSCPEEAIHPDGSFLGRKLSVEERSNYPLNYPSYLEMVQTQFPQAIHPHGSFLCRNLSVEGRNNYPLANPSYLEMVPTQFSQISTQSSNNVDVLQEHYYASGLQQPSFQPYPGGFPSSFLTPMSNVHIPSRTLIAETYVDIVEVESIQPSTSLGG